MRYMVIISGISPRRPHLIATLGSQKLLLIQDHKGRESQHDGAMSAIPEHHGEEEGEGDDGVRG